MCAIHESVLWKSIKNIIKVELLKYIVFFAGRNYMSIVVKTNDTLVRVQGSVNSTNAPVFEEELLAAISGQDLIIDAEGL